MTQNHEKIERERLNQNNANDRVIENDFKIIIIAFHIFKEMKIEQD